jgi:hypothetical protein
LLVLAAILLGVAALPQQHGAVARALVPSEAAREALAGRAETRRTTIETHGASRVVALRHASPDPLASVRELRELVLGLEEQGVQFVDEPRPEPRPLAGRAGCAAAAALLFLLWMALSFKKRRVPERSVVREAVLLAQRGHETLLVERGARFRVVIVDKRVEREDLQVLARLAGGALVLARR